MTTELAPVVRRLFEDFDSLNFEAVRRYITDNAQGVDEISRRWMRDQDTIAGYFAQLRPMLSDVKSTLQDIHEVSWGDTGIVTFWLEQSYVLDGKEQKVSAPTTIALHREDSDWKIALIHSVPLPVEE